MDQLSISLESNQVPVTILTGFLGAGKTTLLNYILTQDHGQKIAVIINEFGEIGIDDKLVVKKEDGIIEMTNGCICCESASDTGKILSQLIERRVLDKLEGRRPSFNRVVIETTGLADPAPVIRSFLVDPSLRNKYYIDAVVVLVDAFHVMNQIMVHHEVKEQIAYADIIVLNKADLVSEKSIQEIQERILSINPIAKIEVTQKSVVDLGKIFNVKSFDIEHKRHLLEKDDGHHNIHDSEITSIVLREERPLALSKVTQWIAMAIMANSLDLLRYKGILNIKDIPERFVFQGVHTHFENMKGSPWLVEEDRVSEIVIIGKNLDEDFFKNSFRDCIA